MAVEKYGMCFSVDFFYYSLYMLNFSYRPCTCLILLTYITTSEFTFLNDYTRMIY